MFDIFVAVVCFWRIILFQDLIPGHDEGDPSKRLTRYKLCYIVCSFLCKYVIDYLESETERTHLHVDARHVLVGHVGPVLWMCMMWAVCRTSALVVHSVWMYVGLPALVVRAIWMYVGLSALVIRALWMYVGLQHWLCTCYMDIYVLLMHWLYMLCGLCGTTALFLHAMCMYVGPQHILYMPGGCIWVHCTGCMWCGSALATVRECFKWGYSLCSC